MVATTRWLDLAGFAATTGTKWRIGQAAMTTGDTQCKRATIMVRGQASPAVEATDACTWPASKDTDPTADLISANTLNGAATTPLLTLDTVATTTIEATWENAIAVTVGTVIETTMIEMTTNDPSA